MLPAVVSMSPENVMQDEVTSHVPTTSPPQVEPLGQLGRLEALLLPPLAPELAVPPLPPSPPPELELQPTLVSIEARVTALMNPRCVCLMFSAK
jgi:hypothetical protein